MKIAVDKYYKLLGTHQVISRVTRIKSGVVSYVIHSRFGPSFASDGTFVHHKSVIDFQNDYVEVKD